MRFLNLGLLLVSAVFSAGCLALAAGAAGGAAASGGNDIEYYIKTEGPPQEIAQAMRDERIIEEMNRAEVRLVMDQKIGYSAEPDRKTSSDIGEEKWLYESQMFVSDPNPDEYIIHINEDGRVIKVIAP